MTYSYNNETYSLNYILKEKNGLCQPEGVSDFSYDRSRIRAYWRLTHIPFQTYKWGFSFLQLFIALLLMSFWTVAVYTVWLRAHRKLSRRGAYEIPNRYKAALRLAGAVSQDFAEFQDAKALTNRDFVEHLRRARDGGRVRGDSAMPVAERQDSLWRSVKNWFKREKWWASVLVIDTLWLCTVWVVLSVVWTPYWLSLWMWLSIVFALGVGTTRKSRLFFVVIWLLLGIAVVFPLTIHDWVREIKWLQDRYG